MKKKNTELSTKFTVAKGRNVKSTVFSFQQDAMITLYCPKYCVVNMLSTMHSQPEIDITSDQNLSIILLYNKIKGTVDTSDKLVRSYYAKRMTRKRPLAFIYYMIDVIAINAFVSWKEIIHENATCA